MDNTKEVHEEGIHHHPSPEAPSPAPVPSHNPSSETNYQDTMLGGVRALPCSPDEYRRSVVVEAEELGKGVKNIVENIINFQKNEIKCEMDGESSINISFIDHENMIKYSKKISNDAQDKDWNDNKKYFHEDFTMFYNVLKTTFNHSDEDMRWNRIEKTDSYLVIEIHNNDRLFGFHFNITLLREEGKINNLERNQNELKEEIHEQRMMLEGLEDKVNTLTEIINWSLSRYRYGDEGELEWLEFKRNNGWSI
tara:strand:+ start:222 stop:977 length:756 start_codon:yes stop_codon:yes gene_type:complete